ncbi:hypothetical protein B0T20DRAFT_456623 [Sordaria brevicollis]|uniref:Uncharacterized protein n=1 Tax=Sordaria brevicollis TaxID=83679 RepID=A0AAE0P1E6_SORBR|nr:hypothetical protein B0T20DRAFT_456623 [Sordaria brevicollis]
MTVNLDQVLFARAEWRMRLLAPCWMVQVGILLSLVGLFAYRLSVTSRTYDDEISHGRDPIVQLVWESTQVGFSSISIALTVAEIWKARSETLTPFFMLCIQIIKTALASGMLGLDAAVQIKYSERHYTIVGLALDCLLLAITMLVFIYAIYTYRRLLKFEAYDLAYNKSGGGYTCNNARGPEKLGYSVQIFGGGHEKKKKKKKKKSTMREPSPTPEVLKSRIDQAIGAEFGWGSRPSGSVTERSGIVVAAGSVHSGVPTTANPRPADLHRARSWVTETGVVGPNTTSSDSGSRMDANADRRRSNAGEDDDYRDYYELAHAHSLSIPTLVVTPEEENGDSEALLTGEWRRVDGGSR